MTRTPNDMPGAKRPSDVAVARTVVEVLGDLHFEYEMGVRGQDVLAVLVSKRLGHNISQQRIGVVMSSQVNEIADIMYPGYRVLIDRATGVYNLKNVISEPGELANVLARMRKVITAGTRSATELSASKNTSTLKSVARIWNSAVEQLDASADLAEDQLASLTASGSWRAMAWAT